MQTCSGESARDNVMLPSTQAAIEGQVEVRWEREGGGGVGAFIRGGMTDGCVWEPCPDPPVHS